MLVNYIDAKDLAIHGTNKKESETKVALKPVCNVFGDIFGRSKAQDRNGVSCVTLRLQTFGMRLSC